MEGTRRACYHRHTPSILCRLSNKSIHQQMRGSTMRPGHQEVGVDHPAQPQPSGPGVGDPGSSPLACNRVGSTSWLAGQLRGGGWAVGAA